MNFWWVNHRQTHASEISGGYIWSPKTERNGSRSQFYINLTRVKPGDLIFSYANAKIMAVGIVTGEHSEQTKPAEFGNTGSNWANIGWIVPIEWRSLDKPFSPKQYINEIAPLLPSSYSPITNQGNGNQKCYLAEISKPLAELLLSIAKIEDDITLDEIDRLEDEISTNAEVQKILKADLEITEKEQLIKARLGQGIYRQRLVEIERKCRLTEVSELPFLVASHIKPWRICDKTERLDGNNGLLLSPHVDRLFDRGWISFSDDGDILISNDRAKNTMVSWGLKVDTNVGTFNQKQKVYLAYHRANIFNKLNRQSIKIIKR